MPAAPMMSTDTSAQRIGPGEFGGVTLPTGCADGGRMTGPCAEGELDPPPPSVLVLVGVADAPVVGVGVAVLVAVAVDVGVVD